MKRILISVCLFLVAAPVVAQKFSYNYVEAGYGESDIEIGNTDVDFEQGFLRYATHYNGTVLLQVELGYGEFDDSGDTELISFESSVGGASQLSRSASVNGGIGMGYLEIDGNGGDSDESYFFGFFGGRQWLVPDSAELYGELRATYIDPDGGDTDTYGSAEAGVRGYIGSDFSLGVSYATTFSRDNRDDETVGVTLRWQYGD